MEASIGKTFLTIFSSLAPLPSCPEWLLIEAFYVISQAILEWIWPRRNTFPIFLSKLLKYKFLEFQDHFLVRAQPNDDRSERGSLPTDVQSVLHRLNHSMCFAHTFISKSLLRHFKSFCRFKVKLNANPLLTSFRHFQRKQNFGRKKCKQKHAVMNWTFLVSNWGIRRNRKNLLFSLVPHRGRWNVLARNDERRSDSYRINLVSTINDYNSFSSNYNSICSVSLSN